MFEIELKFKGNYWESYFGREMEEHEAIQLFIEVTKIYPEKEWRLNYKGANI